MICSIDCETTGLNPSFHEVIQLAIVPLDNWLEPRKDLPLLDLLIRPEHLHRVDEDAMTVSKNSLQEIIRKGIDKEKALMLLEYWYKKLELQENKRIIPLGFGIASFDMPFIREWMGFTQASEYFHGYCRDIMQVCNYLNDVSDFHCEQTPFNKMKLRDIANKLGIEYDLDMVHDAVYDAYLAQQVYKKLLSHQLLNPV